MIGSIRGIAFAATAAACFMVGGAANAAQMTLTKITNNTNFSAVSQIVIDVIDNTTSALFKVSGITGNALSAFYISEAYWDDNGGLFSAISIDSSSNGQNNSVVSWKTTGVTPPNLPSGNTANPTFDGTGGLKAAANNPSPTNGVGINEFVQFKLTYTNGTSFADVISDLKDGSLRLGLHVQGHNTGGSETYVAGGCKGDDCGDGGSGIDPVPVPASLPLLIGALGLTGYIARRRKAA